MVLMMTKKMETIGMTSPARVDCYISAKMQIREPAVPLVRDAGWALRFVD